MPARHRYKCLNPNCPSMTRKTKSMTFDAMNSPMPECPHCGSRRLEDWGVAVNVMGGLSDNSKNSDQNFRRIADRYGLSDMSNKDGQAAKRPAPAPKSNEPTVKVGGLDIPASVAGSGGCVNLPHMAKPMKAQIGTAHANPISSLRGMTQIAAEHKA